MVNVLFHEPNKLTEMAILHDEVKFVLVLECIFELDYPWMFHTPEKLAFDHGLVLFLFTLEFPLDDLFHCIGLGLFRD